MQPKIYYVILFKKIYIQMNVIPIIANGYAHRIPHNPNSNRFDSGPQIFRNSFEFQPKGKATHPTIIQMAVTKKKEIII